MTDSIFASEKIDVREPSPAVLGFVPNAMNGSFFAPELRLAGADFHFVEVAHASIVAL